MPTYKDNDFLNDGASIHIGPDSKEKLMAMIKSDVEVTLKTESHYHFIELLRASLSFHWAESLTFIPLSWKPHFYFVKAKSHFPFIDSIFIYFFGMVLVWHSSSFIWFQLGQKNFSFIKLNWKKSLHCRFSYVWIKWRTSLSKYIIFRISKKL